MKKGENVSRYFKTCVGNGLLTEKYRFTNLGRIRVEGYGDIIQSLRQYFSDVGIPEEEVEEYCLWETNDLPDLICAHPVAAHRLYGGSAS